ncbi:MAG: lipase maturation factor family protein, partial [Verrucomicrobia bacterium]|nr:lipase maturation factor family protein [Verrucomicrobiota bacterium]
HRLPMPAAIAERLYEFVAGHRAAFSRLTRLLCGARVERPGYFLVRRLFLAALGVVYLMAFASLWTQVTGLIGHNGILPASRYLSAAGHQLDQQGLGFARPYFLPTLCWLDPSDAFLNAQCAAGVVLGALLVLGIAPAPCLALLWLLYLSLAVAGQDFLAFQWDNLLLETGFLAIFFAPLHLLPRWEHEGPPSRIVLWLLRALMFKFMLSAGAVKWLGGDQNWHHLTALTFHYYTQPLPTPIAWYANQLPLWFQKVSCGVVLGVEMGAPFLIFAPRRIRFIGCGAFAFLQIMILLSGNYTFFNWLALALCIPLLDDFVFGRLACNKHERLQSRPFRRAIAWPRLITIPLAALVLALDGFQVASLSGASGAWLSPAALAEQWLAPFRAFNRYGLFAVMTTERHEIIVEGSNDGAHWLPYEFKYKPGDVNRAPPFVAPHQPRLDWQMWFAALGDYRDNPWFVRFCICLLRGSPRVLPLLKHNPFPNHPPRYIRAELFDYHFTNFAERQATRAWWKRRRIGEYLPPISLRKGALHIIDRLPKTSRFRTKIKFTALLHRSLTGRQ